MRKLPIKGQEVGYFKSYDLSMHVSYFSTGVEH